MVQLWVNLPAQDKLEKPGYQTLLDRDIPSVDLPDDAGRVRVIAGEFDGRRGPARTFTPIDVWDVRLNHGKAAQFALPEGRTLALVVLHGTVRVNGKTVAHDAQMVLLDRAGTGVSIEAHTDTTIVLLGGEPIDEPIVGYGPFVMNTHAEIRQAVEDFNSGRFGQIVA
jgi:redox-sensitive bicupin YhaK (pirin superfamily)